MSKLLSLVIPVYNEATNLPLLTARLSQVLADSSYDWEWLFVNDASQDDSAAVLEKLAASDQRLKIIEFSRNFGKEIALAAGLKNCAGEAAIMLDADLQHPVEKISEFIAAWEKGADVVVGIRKKNRREGLIKKYGSQLFYQIIRRISYVEITPQATDFRLIDRVVIDEYNRFTEKNRMTRALIDWLGFERAYVDFEANERADGHAGYSFSKLIHLAMNSFISLSLLPLKLAGYLGLLIIFTVGPFGLYIVIGKYFAHWAFAASFSGPAQLAFLLTFLVGIVLVSLGLVALYIAHIHQEVLGRPLYVIKKKKRPL